MMGMAFKNGQRKGVKLDEIGICNVVFMVYLCMGISHVWENVYMGISYCNAL